MSATSRAFAQNAPLLILPPVSAANTAAATSSGVDLTGYEGDVSIIVSTGAITGTLDGKIQDSADNSSFADVSGLTFSQVTAANKIAALTVNVGQVRRYIKYVGTVGTGPVLISVQLAGVKKS